jgi:hypothetical protein
MIDEPVAVDGPAHDAMALEAPQRADERLRVGVERPTEPVEGDPTGPLGKEFDDPLVERDVVGRPFRPLLHRGVERKSRL